MSFLSRFTYLLSGCCLGFFLNFAIFYRRIILSRRYRPISNGIESLVGNTAVIQLQSLSKISGCKILAKVEYLNPGGCSKDRAALAIIKDAERRGLLTPYKSTIYEGTSGSTGISLSIYANARKYKTGIFLPSDICSDKVSRIEVLGAKVNRIEPLPFADKNMYVNAAKRAAMNDDSGFFADQFENECNWRTHYETTAAEIYEQTDDGKNLDFIVLGAGTGGTIAGISKFFKEKASKVKIVLADPFGSGVYNKVKHGVMFSATEKEGTRKRNQVDTIIEGIGMNRITKNLDEALIDDAISVSDQEAVDMSRFILQEEGFFIGSSSALCMAAAFKLAKENRGKTIMTFFCDGGSRHLSKFWNNEYLASLGIVPNPNYWLHYCKDYKID